MKNGKAAVDKGFRVAVREIPLENDEKKNDPDSYITSRQVLDGLEEQDFVLWYAEKAFLSPTTQLGRTEVIKDVCTMLAAVDDPTLASMYLDRLTKKYKEKPAWKLAYNSAVLARRNEDGGEEHGIGERDLYSKYGFFIAGNCYCTYSNKGDVRKFSNFILQPLYDIPDEGTNTRLYRAVNNLGKSAVVSLEPDELNNLQKFRTKVGIAGNYVWLGKIDDLAMVQPYIYSGSETARRIRELGWQEDGFFAYGDGVFTDRFVKADDMGMVKLPGIGLFYLPAFSSMFRRNKLKYGFERSFVYAAKADVGMEDYLSLFVKVFGDNGKVAIAFVFATLFRDFIFDMFEFFPIFNIFGKPQSGKSQLGKAMKGFFTNSYKPINYEGETYPAINRALSQAANCLVHFDEYKNSIEWRKVELLKSMWDGVRRRGACQRGMRRGAVGAGDADYRPCSVHAHTPRDSQQDLIHSRGTPPLRRAYGTQQARGVPPRHAGRGAPREVHTGLSALLRTDTHRGRQPVGEARRDAGLRPHVYELGSGAGSIPHA